MGDLFGGYPTDQTNSGVIKGSAVAYGYSNATNSGDMQAYYAQYANQMYQAGFMDPTMQQYTQGGAESGSVLGVSAQQYSQTGSMMGSDSQQYTQPGSMMGSSMYGQYSAGGQSGWQGYSGNHSYQEPSMTAKAQTTASAMPSSLLLPPPPPPPPEEPEQYEKNKQQAGFLINSHSGDGRSKDLEQGGFLMNSIFGDRGSRSQGAVVGRPYTSGQVQASDENFLEEEDYSEESGVWNWDSSHMRPERGMGSASQVIGFGDRGSGGRGAAVGGPYSLGQTQSSDDKFLEEVDYSEEIGYSEECDVWNRDGSQMRPERGRGSDSQMMSFVGGSRGRGGDAFLGEEEYSEEGDVWYRDVSQMRPERGRRSGPQGMRGQSARGRPTEKSVFDRLGSIFGRPNGQKQNAMKSDWPVEEENYEDEADDVYYEEPEEPKRFHPTNRGGGILGAGRSRGASVNATRGGYSETHSDDFDKLAARRYPQGPEKPVRKDWGLGETDAGFENRGTSNVRAPAKSVDWDPVGDGKSVDWDPIDEAKSVDWDPINEATSELSSNEPVFVTPDDLFGRQQPQTLRGRGAQPVQPRGRGAPSAHGRGMPPLLNEGNDQRGMGRGAPPARGRGLAPILSEGNDQRGRGRGVVSAHGRGMPPLLNEGVQRGRGRGVPIANRGRGGNVSAAEKGRQHKGKDGLLPTPNSGGSAVGLSSPPSLMNLTIKNPDAPKKIALAPKPGTPAASVDWSLISKAVETISVVKKYEEVIHEKFARIQAEAKIEPPAETDDSFLFFAEVDRAAPPTPPGFSQRVSSREPLKPTSQTETPAVLQTWQTLITGQGEDLLSAKAKATGERLKRAFARSRSSSRDRSRRRRSSTPRRRSRSDSRSRSRSRRSRSYSRRRSRSGSRRRRSRSNRRRSRSGSPVRRRPSPGRRSRSKSPVKSRLRSRSKSPGRPNSMPIRGPPSPGVPGEEKSSNPPSRPKPFDLKHRIEIGRLSKSKTPPPTRLRKLPASPGRPKRRSASPPATPPQTKSLSPEPLKAPSPALLVEGVVAPRKLVRGPDGTLMLEPEPEPTPQAEPPKRPTIRQLSPSSKDKCMSKSPRGDGSRSPRHRGPRPKSPNPGKRRSSSPRDKKPRNRGEGRPSSRTKDERDARRFAPQSSRRSSVPSLTELDLESEKGSPGNSPKRRPLMDLDLIHGRSSRSPVSRPPRRVFSRSPEPAWEREFSPDPGRRSRPRRFSGGSPTFVGGRGSLERRVNLVSPGRSRSPPPVRIVNEDELMSPPPLDGRTRRHRSISPEIALNRRALSPGRRLGSPVEPNRRHRPFSREDLHARSRSREGGRTVRERSATPEPLGPNWSVRSMSVESGDERRSLTPSNALPAEGDLRLRLEALRRGSESPSAHDDDVRYELERETSPEALAVRIEKLYERSQSKSPEPQGRKRRLPPPPSPPPGWVPRPSRRIERSDSGDRRRKRHWSPVPVTTNLKGPAPAQPIVSDLPPGTSKSPESVDRRRRSSRERGRRRSRSRDRSRDRTRKHSEDGSPNSRAKLWLSVIESTKDMPPRKAPPTMQAPPPMAPFYTMPPPGMPPPVIYNTSYPPPPNKK